jgi:tRNA threonylcarbamoyladenosine biosynthesis protein TsaB
MLLSIHTCGSIATVALARFRKDDVQVVASADLGERASSMRLVPEIAAMLEKQGSSLREVQGIVVVNGPGSFTGIRVGLSTAKGLSEGANIPIIAVSRLAVLARASLLPHVLCAIDAGRGEYYVGEYRNGERVREVLLTGEETVALASEPGAGVLVCEESRAEDASSACGALARCGPVYVQPADAAEALRFALPRWRARDFDDTETLEANYLRRSDAEVLQAVKNGSQRERVTPHAEIAAEADAGGPIRR